MCISTPPRRARSRRSLRARNRWLRPRDEWVNCMRDRLGAENCTLAVELRKDGSFVGRASLAKTFLRTWQSVDIEWEMRILIARKFWSRGFGREVASILIRAGFALAEVTSIVAVVDPENAASRNLMDNLGFQYVDQKSSPGHWDDKHMIFRLTKPIWNDGTRRCSGRPVLSVARMTQANTTFRVKDR
jgi:RimJ/RimL family protein N-acetyltransferase